MSYVLSVVISSVTFNLYYIYDLMLDDLCVIPLIYLNHTLITFSCYYVEEFTTNIIDYLILL